MEKRQNKGRTVGGKRKIQEKMDIVLWWKKKADS